jgi:hypothetical protein
MEELPPSLDAAAEAAEAGEFLAPEDRRLPRTYFGRSRGALLVLGLVGLAAFFLPWVEMTAPEIASYSGFDLARGRAGWLWGGAVGWFILVPLVWTRRTIYKMRGVRVISAFFAALTLAEIVMMLLLPPRGHRLVPFEFHWGVGFWLSGIASVLGVIAAIRFGGRLDDIPALPWEDRNAHDVGEPGQSPAAASTTVGQPTRRVAAANTTVGRGGDEPLH